MLKIALIGRPNVGKSYLFNRIAKKKLAIVEDEDGITRDRISTICVFEEQKFILIDTAGIEPKSDRVFNKEVLDQTKLAILEADILIMVADAKIGVTALDLLVSKLLHKSKKQVFLAINKVDSEKDEDQNFEFQKLAVKNFIDISCEHNRNIDELLKMALSKNVLDNLGKFTYFPKLAIVGRENVGKSSILNFLLNQNRVVTSSIAGTTRDSVYIDAKVFGKLYTFIDTAGFKRKKSQSKTVQKYADIRTEKAIEDSDLCLLIIDVKEGILTYDKKIAKKIFDNKKPCIILLNKWDLVKNFRQEHLIKALNKEISFLSYTPKIFTSIVTKRGIDEKLFLEIEVILQKAKIKIGTSQLNSFIQKCIEKYHPPYIAGKRLKIFYAVHKNHFQFILFVNYPHLFLKTYERYLLNRIRENFDLSGLPLSLELQGKGFEKDKDFG